VNLGRVHTAMNKVEQ